MAMVDVLIVGACTAGTYLAHLLAQKGLNVLVIEKDTEENLCSRLDIIHFPTDGFEAFGIPLSDEGDAEYVRRFEICKSLSALNQYPKQNANRVTVLHLPLFIKRLQKMAMAHGAEFRFNTPFDHLLYDQSGEICGVVTESGEALYSRLVVDASGIPSVVRRQVNHPLMETFEIGPKDKFYVLLKYVELQNEDDKVELSTSWPYYKGWIAPQHNNHGAIIGVGANLSFDYARKCMKKFEDAIPLPPYTLQYEEAGSTPYCRPPYSFVCDRFLAIGDAAALTYPMSGEGIAMAWRHCQMAVPVICKALENGHFPTAADLWPINVAYQRGEGAECASLRATLVWAVKMSPKDNDFMFSQSVVFRDDDDDIPSSEASRLLRGVLSRKFSLRAFMQLLRGLSIGGKLEKHYKAFPDTPKAYASWVKKAQKLWRRAGTMADTIKDADT